MSIGRKILSISVIIPALDEAACLHQTLTGLAGIDHLEAIVVDGGSRDETMAIAAAHGAVVISAPRGRGCQMNAGAVKAQGELLLFLHADTLLPLNFASEISRIMACPGVAAGAFRLEISGRQKGLRLVAAAANLRATWLRMPYGDQALFLHRNTFSALGGFPDQPFLEDVAMVRKLRRLGRIAISPLTVVTSGRRWERLGLFRTTFLNQVIVLAYLLGFSPLLLARWYHGVRVLGNGRLTRNESLTQIIIPDEGNDGTRGHRQKGIGEGILQKRPEAGKVAGQGHEHQAGDEHPLHGAKQTAHDLVEPLQHGDVHHLLQTTAQHHHEKVDAEEENQISDQEAQLGLLDPGTDQRRKLAVKHSGCHEPQDQGGHESKLPDQADPGASDDEQQKQSGHCRIKKGNHPPFSTCIIFQITAGIMPPAVPPCVRSSEKDVRRFGIGPAPPASGPD
jgi:rSAM/selenodomain-associated transferase 2